jgi:hypothetical protein
MTKPDHLFSDAPAPAEAATDLGADSQKSSEDIVWELIRTLLLVIVVVATTALIAALV